MAIKHSRVELFMLLFCSPWAGTNVTGRLPQGTGTRYGVPVPGTCHNLSWPPLLWCAMIMKLLSTPSRTCVYSLTCDVSIFSDVLLVIQFSGSLVLVACIPMYLLFIISLLLCLLSLTTGRYTGYLVPVPVVDFMLLYLSLLGTFNLFLHFIYELLQLSHMNHSTFQLLETP